MAAEIMRHQALAPQNRHIRHWTSTSPSAERMSTAARLTAGKSAGGETVAQLSPVATDGKPRLGQRTRSTGVVRLFRPAWKAYRRHCGWPCPPRGLASADEGKLMMGSTQHRRHAEEDRPRQAWRRGSPPGSARHRAAEIARRHLLDKAGIDDTGLSGRLAFTQHPAHR